MGKNIDLSGDAVGLVLEVESAVLKAAKKLLKKNTSSSSSSSSGGSNNANANANANANNKGDHNGMKLKTLAQLVCEKVKNQDLELDQVKVYIQKCEQFEVNKKKVSLKRKLSTTTTTSSSSSSSKDKKNTTVEKARKKFKSNHSSSSSLVNSQSTKDKKIAGHVASISTWREDRKIVLVGNDAQASAQLNNDPAFFPFCSFDDDCGKNAIHSALLKHCTVAHGFQNPSPIQAQAWPILTKGHDVIGIAETGSGKTLAFSLPALTRLSNQSKSHRTLLLSSSSSSSPSPRMLVLAPTRELAMQSDAVLQEFGAVVGLQSLVVYGGVPKYQQTCVLKRGGVDCLVATPGRLKDLIQEQSCSLDQVEFLVLDEADRMLDMGFEQDVRFIISQCPTQLQGRQTAMFSATWPAVIQKIAMDFMKKYPIRVYVGFEKISSGEEDDHDSNRNGNGNGGNGNNAHTVDDSLSANKRVQQNVEVMEDRMRWGRLKQILNQVHKAQKDRVLLFCLYKKEAERMELMLQRDGWKCNSIHGNKHQQARTTALQDFKSGACPLLIATDVAARGLDIPNVQVVINYTFPLTIEDYVHRIGRTGRAGQNGISYTFFQPVADKAHAGALQHVLRQAQQEIPKDLKKFGSTIKKKEHKLYGSFGPKDGPMMKQATKITFDSDNEEQD